MEPKSQKIRVLVVDDSALARKILVEGFSKDPQIEVIGAARDPFKALEILSQDRPDVITLDVEMPGMDGVTFLRKYMPQYPIPTIIVSSLTEKGKQVSLDALEAGAVDVVTKPTIGVVDGLPAMMSDLCARVKAAARANVHLRVREAGQALSPPIRQEDTQALRETTDRVIAIGASAGGVSALANILPAFPPASTGIVIVQHMPGGFTASFAERLDGLSQMHVKEAEHGDRVRPGLVLLAPGGSRHLEIHRSGGEYRIALVPGPKVSGHQPSVDVLFRSVAKYVGRNAVAALLTGMGEDGAAGLLAIRLAGGRTFCQDEATSVVWGMPGVAWKNGAAEAALPLNEVPARLLYASTMSRP
jgi:two-component system, chemotaxis family, protein-glutamate methylesterase/glutaminase